MDSEGSLPHSQVPAACPYLEPVQSSPCLPTLTSWRTILLLSSHLDGKSIDQIKVPTFPLISFTIQLCNIDKKYYYIK